MQNKEERTLKTAPEISIIIVGYSVYNDFSNTIISINNQTFKDFEVICIVPQDVQAEIRKNFPDINLVKPSDFSQLSKNSKIRNCLGKYLLFINSGDEIAPNTLFKLHNAATKHCCDLVMSKLDDSRYKLKTKFYKYDINNFQNLDTTIWGKLFKKEIFYENGISLQNIDNDEVFFWMFMPFVSNLYYIDEIFYTKNQDKCAAPISPNFVSQVYKIYHYLQKQHIYRLYRKTFLGYIASKINSCADSTTKKISILTISLFLPEAIRLLIYDFILEIRLLRAIHNLRENTVLWGASFFLQDFLQKYKIKNKYIKGIIDKNPNKIGTSIGGFKVLSPKELQNSNVKLVIMTIKNSSLVNYCRIKNSLAEFPEIKLHPNIFETDFMKNPAASAKIERTTPRKTLEQIEYHLADHCNLSCQGCSHFSPLAQKCFPDVQIFERDMKRLSDLSKGKLKRFFLLGGEPLLNPQIIDFIRISRQYFPDTRISILTNAVLLNSQKEEFWKACNNFNIIISITKYPVKLDFEQMEQIAANNNVELEYYNNTEVIKTSQRFPLDLTGKQNLKESFCCCSQANTCIFLSNGKLYTCPIAPNIVHFNKFFNKDIPLNKKDGIDIYKAKSIKEILTFLSRPIPFCKYCKVSERSFGHAWSISKKEISEWL